MSNFSDPRFINATATFSTSSPSRLGWVAQPDKRGTTGIVWGCVLVLFVCVWTVLHPNIPFKTDGQWSIFCSKMRWATLAIFAPELLTLFAAMQWNCAHLSVKEMRELGDSEWSIVHAFYANAGGFVLATPDFPAFPINAKSIHYLRANDWIRLPEITRESIWDRSKTDVFAKGVAFIQSGWLLLQGIARAVQNLPITPLELFTIAFIVPTVVTTFFWANKPQNVLETTLIEVDWPIANVLIAAGDVAKEPYVDTPMDFVEKPVCEGWKRHPSLLHFGGLQQRPLVRIPNGFSPPLLTGMKVLFVWLISVIHAGIHFLGWSFPFPTYTETLIWRSCSLILLIMMVFGGAGSVLGKRPWFDFSLNFLGVWILEARRKTWVRVWLLNLVFGFGYTIYIIVRLLLCAEIFICFRSLPADVYDDIKWAAFLPHV